MHTEKTRILGVSASLRNARRGLGNQDLIEELKALSTEEELNNFLAQEAATHLKNFEEAGRTSELPFDQLYKNLKKLKGDRGLSNSEVALAAALWSAYQLGSEIDHVSLSEYYTESGVHNEEELLEKLKQADGILLSTPVYFGDRSSLAQTFMERMRDDMEWKEAVNGKVFAGIAVGAKRNGGQETTLIYQLLDILNIGMLGVGNDSETTSQYGGTGLAGDVGTMPKDGYGLATSMGAGRRLSRVTQLRSLAGRHEAKGKARVQFWILQDKDNYALRTVMSLTKGMPIDADIIDISEKHVMRCLACDICPTDVDVDEKYRCIIKSGKDSVGDMHSQFLGVDAVIPVIYSPKNRTGMQTNYQKFLERTRYLRRGDYLFSNTLSSPLILEEVGANENMHIRAMTSMVRHHTILYKPMIGVIHQNALLNEEDIREDLKGFCTVAENVMVGRLSTFSKEMEHLKYRPIGYVLSAAKDKEDEKLKRRETMVQDRYARNEKLKDEKVK